MTLLLLAALRKIWPYALAAGVILAACLWLNFGWHNGVARKAEAANIVLQANLNQQLALIKDAEKRAADLALLWSAQADKTEQAQQERDSERAKREQTNTEAVRNLPAAVANVRIPAGAISLLNHAIDAEQPATPAAAGKPDATDSPSAEDSDVGLVTQWAVTVIGLYAACRDTVTGWQSFYSGLIAAQPKE